MQAWLSSHEVQGLISACGEMRLCLPSRNHGILSSTFPDEKDGRSDGTVAKRGPMLESQSLAGNPCGSPTIAR